MLSYAHGVYDRPLLGETIGQNLERTIARVPDSPALISCHQNVRYSYAEFGELATALAKGTDRANIEEEFADVIAWLCTLANINDVNLAAVVAKKYLGNEPPEGHK